MEKPDGDEISGIAPAVAIAEELDAESALDGGNFTEIYDYFAAIVRRAGRRLHQCGSEVRAIRRKKLESRVGVEGGAAFYILYNCDANGRASWRGKEAARKKAAPPTRRGDRSFCGTAETRI